MILGVSAWEGIKHDRYHVSKKLLLFLKVLKCGDSFLLRRPDDIANSEFDKIVKWSDIPSVWSFNIYKCISFQNLMRSRWPLFS